MDQSTHNVRRSSWLNIISQCQERPANMTAKQWLIENDINEKRYYYWLRKFRDEAYDKMQHPVVSSSTEVSFAEVSYPVETVDSNKHNLLSTHNDPKTVAVIKCKSFSMELTNDISDSLLSRLLQEVRNV